MELRICSEDLPNQGIQNWGGWNSPADQFRRED